MRIEGILGTTLQDIASQTFNPFLGISINNRYFSKDAITDYIKWMLSIAKTSVLVLIADDIQAINYQVLSSLDSKEALERARRKGAQIENCVRAIISNLSSEDQERVKIAHWKDVGGIAQKARLETLQIFYSSNARFQEYILGYVKRNLGSRTQQLSKDQLDVLATYLLSEIALILSGIVHNGVIYDLNPYPGPGTSELFTEMQNGLLFPEIKADSSCKKSCFVDAYAD